MATSAAEPDAPVVLVTAVPEELGGVLSLLERRRPVTAGESGSPALHEGWLSDVPVLAFVGGDGPRRAAEGVAAVLERTRGRGVRGLLGLGIAGGLDPALSRGDLVLGRRFFRGGSVRLAGDGAWLALGEQAGGRPGTLMTEDHLLGTTGDKVAAFSALDGEGPAAVDLESYFWAREAARSGLPFLIARAVLDTAREELPAFLLRCQREDGSVDRRRVARAAATAPWRIPALLALARRTAACSEALAAFAAAFLSALRGRS